MHSWCARNLAGGPARFQASARTLPLSALAPLPETVAGSLGIRLEGEAAERMIGLGHGGGCYLRERRCSAPAEPAQRQHGHVVVLRRVAHELVQPLEQPLDDALGGGGAAVAEDAASESVGASSGDIRLTATVARTIPDAVDEVSAWLVRAQ